VGARGAGSKQDDFTEHLFVATTHEYLLIFTEQGRMFWLRAYEVPETAKTSKGTPLQNLIDKPKEDAVRSVLNVRNLRSPDYLENTFLMFCTEQGTVKKTPLEAYSRPRAAGINAITINEGDRLLDVQLLSGSAQVILASRSGRAVRFPEEKVRPMGRTAAGVRGISLNEEEPGDKVVGMVCIADSGQQELLVVSDNGYGKRSALDGEGGYRITNRGGKGVRAMMLTEKTGKLVSIQAVTDADDLMIINRSGLTIRLSMSELRTIGRATQGVRLFKVAANDEISSVAKVAAAEVEELVAEATSEAALLGVDLVSSAQLPVAADDASEDDDLSLAEEEAAEDEGEAPQ
jgi:DNA gyrase subunit A